MVNSGGKILSGANSNCVMGNMGQGMYLDVGHIRMYVIGYINGITLSCFDSLSLCVCVRVCLCVCVCACMHVHACPCMLLYAHLSMNLFYIFICTLKYL